MPAVGHPTSESHVLGGPSGSPASSDRTGFLPEAPWYGIPLRFQWVRAQEGDSRIDPTSEEWSVSSLYMVAEVGDQLEARQPLRISSASKKVSAIVVLAAGRSDYVYATLRQDDLQQVNHAPLAVHYIRYTHGYFLDWLLNLSQLLSRLEARDKSFRLA